MAKKPESTNFSEGFIRLPRSLLESEKWNALRFRQQKLFLYILLKAQYAPYVYKHNGKDIQLMPGDLCISMRRLVDDFNSSVKFKDEKIDLPFLQRAVSTFLKVGLTDTRTDTGITIISIVYPGVYDSKNSLTDTQSNTLSIQNRYSHLKEEGKKDKKEEEKKEIAQSAKKQLRSKDSLSFDFEKWEFIGITDDERLNWALMYPHIDLYIETLKAIEWLKKNPSKQNKTLWRKFLTGWFQRANDYSENKKAYQSAKGSPQNTDRRTKDVEGKPVDNQYAGKF